MGGIALTAALWSTRLPVVYEICPATNQQGGCLTIARFVDRDTGERQRRLDSAFCNLDEADVTRRIVCIERPSVTGGYGRCGGG